MSVDAAEPEGEEPEDRDEFLADDDTPVEAVPIEIKHGRGRPRGMTREESERLSGQMWDEYAGGMTMKAIGDLHGMTHPAVLKRLRKHRARFGIEDIVEAKALDLGRYEALIERVWTKAFEDPSPENIRILALLMDQRAKLLGLNAPKKLTVDGAVDLTPSPALVTLLERVQSERDRLGGGTLGRLELPSPNTEVVDAELISDD